MRSCTLAVVTLRATPRAENITSNTKHCTIDLTTLQDATFQTGSTHAAKTAPPAPREMVLPLYHGHSYQQQTVDIWKLLIIGHCMYSITYETVVSDGENSEGLEKICIMGTRVYNQMLVGLEMEWVR
jgi:hypothetical protein